MTVKIARANVRPQRQPNQYSCTTTSLSTALEALGIPQAECNVERVNAVLGAQPLQGASWDQVAGAASHFGCRATLVVPSTLKQVRAWTDAGTPVLIGWNTGSEWSHASLIFDVTDTHVHIADPNITNPEKLVHVLTHDEFYDKWYEKAAPGYKIRRSAMAIEREITQEGRQVMASNKTAEAADCVSDYKAGGLSWEDYQDCLKSWEEEDGEGGGYGGGGYGGGSYGGGSYGGGYSRPSKITQTGEMMGLVGKAIIAASTYPQMRDGKDVKFLKSIQSATGVSEKQASWRDSLLKKLEHRIREIPKDMKFRYGDQNTLHLGRAEDKDHVRFVEKYFESWGPGMWDSILVGPNGKAPQQHTSPSSDDPKLKVLDLLLAKRPGDGFITSIRNQIAQGKKLSEAQLKAVRMNLYKNSMRAEAEAFRVASVAEIFLGSRTGKKLKEVWGVADPTNTSELEDIWFNLAPVVYSALDRADITIFDSKSEAKAEAQKRLLSRDK